MKILRNPPLESGHSEEPVDSEVSNALRRGRLTDLLKDTEDGQTALEEFLKPDR